MFSHLLPPPPQLSLAKVESVILSRLLILFLLIGMPLTAFSDSFSGTGSGTKTDPYLIFNAYHLYQMRYCSGKYFKLMADIDLTDFIKENDPDQGWEPLM